MSRRKGVVLIIDDEEEIRESIELLLNSEGLSTDTAGNGQGGLKKIDENLYDAVLLDLMLPGKSGMEVQKEIKRIDPTLPVIIITAIGAVETAVTATKKDPSITSQSLGTMRSWSSSLLTRSNNANC